MRLEPSSFVAPQTAAFLIGIAAAGALALQMSATARTHVHAKPVAPAPAHLGPRALVAAGASGRIAVSAAGSYALVTRGSSASRVTLVRASDGATLFTGSLAQLKRLDLGRLSAGETYTMRVERGAPVQATLIAAV